ncbi:MAG: amidohydrolase family protein [Promethearchaeia archaeon]
MIDGINIWDAHMHYMGRFKARNKSIIEYMDNYGIDKAVITTLNKTTSMKKLKSILGSNSGGSLTDFSAHFDLTSQLDHEPVRKIVSQYPRRVVGFYWFNPKDPSEEDWDLLTTYIEAYNFRGVKTQPTVNMLNVPRDYYNLAEFCIAHNIPLYIHTGSSFFFQKAIRAKDLYRLAKKYPELKLIIGHAAHSMEYCINLLTYFSETKNVYFETSCSIPYGILALTKGFGSERVIYGSDSPPATTPEIEIKKIKILNLNKNQLENIFYNNIEKLVSENQF